MYSKKIYSSVYFLLIFISLSLTGSNPDAKLLEEKTEMIEKTQKLLEENQKMLLEKDQKIENERRRTDQVSERGGRRE